jgi:CRP/FNR family transcriptional regulator, nitrogen oxide reductase regulator
MNVPIEKLLAASRLFGRVRPELRAHLAQYAVRRTFAHGERVFATGESPLRFNLILSGVVKLVQPTADGGEAIVGVYGPRESVGDAAILERGPYAHEAVVASKTADVLSVDAAPVLALAERDLEIADAITRALLDHAEMLQEKITVMSAGSVPKRLATLFLALAERFGDERFDGALTIPVALSRGELACLISARVETTIRVVRKFERMGLLETNGGGFVIRDVAGLVAETRVNDLRSPEPPASSAQQDRWPSA